MKRLIIPALLSMVALGLVSGVPFLQRVALAVCWIAIFAGGMVATEAKALLDGWLARPQWSVWPTRVAAVAVAICLAGFGHWITWAFFLPIVLFAVLAPNKPCRVAKGASQ